MTHGPIFVLPWWAPFTVAIALSVVVIAIEVKTYEIPNAITLGLLVVAGCVGLLEMKLASHFGGFAISALVCGVLYRQDLLGGGGVKWTCALCTLLGIRDGVLMMFVAALLAGASMAIAKLRSRPGGGWTHSSPLLLAGILVALANVVAERRGLW